MVSDRDLSRWRCLYVLLNGNLAAREARTKSVSERQRAVNFISSKTKRKKSGSVMRVEKKEGKGMNPKQG
jgi:hypothetical protein